MAPGSVSADTPSGATFSLLPPEVRLKIYNFLFQTIISDLADNLFAIFTVFDNTYDTTRDLQIQCEPYEQHMRCPHRPISTSLCSHHRAGLLATMEPPRLSPKVWQYYKFDFAAVFMDVKPAFKTWVEKDKEMWGRVHAGENPFRSGLTSILLVNRTIYHEAVKVLYEHAEIVVHLHEGLDYLEKQNRLECRVSYPRFEGVHLTPFIFAKKLKLNISLNGVGPIHHLEKLIQRLERLMDVLENCSHLDSLEISVDYIYSDGSNKHCSRVMEVLKARLSSRSQTQHLPLLVSLGMVSVAQCSSEAVDAFLDAVNGWVLPNSQKPVFLYFVIPFCAWMLMPALQKVQRSLSKAVGTRPD